MPTAKKGNALLIIFFLMVGVTIVAASFFRSLSWYCDIVAYQKKYWQKHYTTECIMTLITISFFDGKQSGNSIYTRAPHRCYYAWHPNNDDKNAVDFEITIDNTDFAHGTIFFSENNHSRTMRYHTVTYTRLCIDKVRR